MSNSDTMPCSRKPAPEIPGTGNDMRRFSVALQRSGPYVRNECQVAVSAHGKGFLLFIYTIRDRQPICNINFYEFLVKQR